MAYFCESYCSHGSRCKQAPGHDGLHDSGYCTWVDAESLTREAADEILRQKPGGAGFLANRYEFSIERDGVAYTVIVTRDDEG